MSRYISVYTVKMKKEKTLFYLKNSGEIENKQADFSIECIEKGRKDIFYELRVFCRIKFFVWI